jgi:uncharacterized lipoprotein YajG
MLLGRAMCVGAALCLSACDSFSEEKITVEYVPTASFARIPGAENVNLVVTAQDRRVQYRDRIGVKRTINAPNVIAANDVVEVVRGAVERELRSSGFALAQGGLIVSIDLQNFYSDFSSSLAIMASVANVTFTLRVRDGTGATRYVHTYVGEGLTNGTLNQSGQHAKETLQLALANAVKQVMGDSALIAALQSERPGMPVSSIPRGI